MLIGDAAFEELYQDEHRRLVGLGTVLTGDRTVAEDLVQDTFLEAHRRWDSIADYDDPAAWLRRVLANKATSRGRRLTTEAKGVQRLGQRVEMSSEPPEWSPEVWEAVARLPKRQAQAITLAYWEDLGVDQIADKLDVGRESVRTHLKRGRAKLPADLGDLDSSDRRRNMGRGALVALVALVIGISLVAALSRDGELRELEAVGEDALGETLMLTAAASGESITPVYSGTQAFNADGSRILLYQSGGERSGHLTAEVSGTTQLELLPLTIDPTDIEDITWDPVDPDLLWFVVRGTNRLTAVDVRTSEETQSIVVDACTLLSSGSTSGSINGTTTRFGYRCEHDGAPTDLVSIDIESGDSSQGPMPEGAGDAGPQTLASGDGFVMLAEETVLVLDLNFAPLPVSPLPIDASSMVTALDGDGRDLVVASAFDGDHVGPVVVADVATGEISVLGGPDDGYPFPHSGAVVGQISGSADRVVAIGGATGTAVDDLEPIDGEILVVDLTRPFRLQRVVHHEATANERFDAWSIPMIGLSPDGKTLIYSSDKGTDSVNTYSVPLN